MSTGSRKRPRHEGGDWTSDSDPICALVSKPKIFTPRMDRYRSGDPKVVTAKIELSGLKREDVMIDLLHDKLTISGEIIDQQSREGSPTYTRRELPYGKFNQCLAVPLGLRPEDVKARMENGLLTVTYPKDAPYQKPHHISIE